MLKRRVFSVPAVIQRAVSLGKIPRSAAMTQAVRAYPTEAIEARSGVLVESAVSPKPRLSVFKLVKSRKNATERRISSLMISSNFISNGGFLQFRMIFHTRGFSLNKLHWNTSRLNLCTVSDVIN